MSVERTRTRLLHNPRSLPPADAAEDPVPTGTNTVIFNNIDLEALLDNTDVDMSPAGSDQKSPFANTLSLKERLLAAQERGNKVSTNTNTNTAKDPIEKYTPQPAKKPEIHYSHPTAAFDNIDIDQVCSWENLPGVKLLAHPFGHEVRTPELQPDIKMKVFSAIVEITQSNKIGFYAPKRGASPRETPTVFLIYNLTEPQRQILLNREVWSSKAITFRVTTMEPVRPDYLFSIRGFTTKSEDEVKEAVRHVWSGKIPQNLLTALRQNLPEALHHKTEMILQNVTDTLRIKRLDTKNPGDASAPTFNIYIQANIIHDDGLWYLLRNHYAAQEYALPFQQPGHTSANLFHCTICHNIDHPRGLCTFPKVEGWNGPVWRIPGPRRDTSNKTKNRSLRQKRANWGNS
jgi:hypothetical protein